MDLHRLVSDVRRRVEHEVTFEGHEKRTKSVQFNPFSLTPLLSSATDSELIRVEW
jgi:peroxin-3